MFKTKLKNLSIITITIILTLGFSISLQSLLAGWTAPTAVAPANNTETPINVGNVGQSKNSGLILNAGAINANGLIVQSGKVGIDTTNPNEALTVNGALSLVESTATPAATAGYGKIYLKGLPVVASDATSTKLLLHANSVLVDDSTSNKTINNIGSVTIVSDNKFGGGSLNFNGSSCLQTPYSSDFDFGNSDFTIDFWAYNLSGNGGTVIQLSDAYVGASIGYVSGGNLVVYLTSPGGGLWAITWGASMGALPGATWTHYALVRSGSTFYTFRNGTQVSTFSSSAAIYMNPSTPVNIGRYRDTAGGVNYLSGNVDELHVAKGIAKWTSSFTPPAQEYTMNGAGNIYSPYFKDSAGNETALAGGTSGASSVWGQSGADIFYSTGKVGVGTSSPSSAFDVNGDICATVGGIRKCLSGASDLPTGAMVGRCNFQVYCPDLSSCRWPALSVVWPGIYNNVSWNDFVYGSSRPSCSCASGYTIIKVDETDVPNVSYTRDYICMKN